jgi:hypothetical protein
MRAPLINSTKEIPGSGFRRAGAKYSNFDWRQSYDKNINFALDTQA